MEELNAYSQAGTPFIFIIDFDKQKPIVIPIDKVDSSEILYNIKGFTNYNDTAHEVQHNFSFEKYPIPFAEYKSKFDRVQSHLKTGNSYLVNITYPTEIETSLSLKNIFEWSVAPYKLWYKDKFTVFSPEPFIKIEDGIISSYPMKGTINASIHDAEKILLADEKELAEHSTMADLIRNDLSMVATDVKLERFRYISRIKTYNSELLQVSSEISGKVKKELMKNIGELLSLLLPAGSISGAPKKKTVEIIKEIEGYDRGYYTGVFGYFDGKKLESSVMIRFIENINGKLYFKSGGGVTVYSNCESEYKELIDKVYVPINRNN